MVPVTELREALRRAIASTSLRAVATEVGLSPSGLRTFVARGRPHPRTIYLATTWLVRHRDPGATDSATARAGVGALTDHLSARAQKDTVGKISEVLREASRRDGKNVPKWLRELE